MKKCINCEKTTSQTTKRCWKCYMEWRKNPRNHPCYIDGRSREKNYCLDCKKEINWQAKGCLSCSNKKENNPNYKGNKALYKQKFYCKDCGKEICMATGVYGQRRCRSCARKVYLKNPKNHPSYIDGKGQEHYTKEFNNELKLKIRQRDNFECQNCNMTEEEHIMVYGRVLCIHHIDYDKKNCKEENLITLCGTCNLRANSDRDYRYTYYTYIRKKK